MTDHPAVRAEPHAATPSDDTAAPGAVARWRQRRRNRVTRWDRPPQPRDWRFFVGGLGRILIATGLLLFGFVAYQLWGTGIETARAQAGLESEFEQLVGNSEAVDDHTGTDEGSADAGYVLTPKRPATAGADSNEIDGDMVDIEPADATIDEIIPAEDQGLPPVVPDQAIMRLEIPRLGVNVMVLPGVDRDDLKKGPGHFPDTPLPGQLGNSSLAGHRTTYGAPFNELDELEVGDRIIVTRIDGNRYVYEVTGRVIVNPNDYWVVSDSDPTRATLTLTTCHPETTASQRMAVFSELVADESGPVGEATFYDGFGATDNPSATSGVEHSNDGTPDGSDSATTTDETLADQHGTDVELSTTAQEAPSIYVEDAFAEGWFADADAWPQIGLWGMVLAAVTAIGYLIARRLRSLPIGIIVSIVPFLVTLYFFYQNVNRLLPAGL